MDSNALKEISYLWNPCEYELDFQEVCLWDIPLPEIGRKMIKGSSKRTDVLYHIFTELKIRAYVRDKYHFSRIFVFVNNAHLSASFKIKIIYIDACKDREYFLIGILCKWFFSILISARGFDIVCINMSICLQSFQWQNYSAASKQMRKKS